MTATIPIVFLIVATIMWAPVNNSTGGKGYTYYFHGGMPLQDGSGVYDPSSQRGSLLKDAFNQVFFSIGVGVGIFYAYASYNPIRQPVIAIAVGVAILDWLFAFIAGFMVWAIVGFLVVNKDASAYQNNGVGLMFIGVPTASVKAGKEGLFAFTLLTLWISGIDAAMSYIESITTNLIDATELPRAVCAGGVVAMGIILTSIFTTNVGWVLFDMVDHYTSDYLVLAIVLLQCISVGWQFEADTTSALSEGHKNAQKTLGCMYWIPVVTLGFYAHFGFGSNKEIALIIMVLTTLMACVASYARSKMPAASWFYEIFMCGVGKLSMSITSLSKPGDDTRDCWMGFFEIYFGVAVKFINPAILTYMLFENFANDVRSPYAEQPMDMQVYSSIIIFVMLMILIAPMFLCEYPEIFKHNIDLEFMADVMFEAKIRAQSQGKVQPAMEMSNAPTNKPNIDDEAAE
jgi:SNF family Na+-dependent transporter